ncbi:hypothetical protein [Rhizobium sp. 18055]|uniref:hypothetical protein n=1 Tax=Rhizobium sp. 18055 TaxID=2681403 RepID=UPI0013587E05|nr:hypothetical protein [Rhizobium sp. 18055]
MSNNAVVAGIAPFGGGRMREGGFKIQARRADALSADPRDKPEDDEKSGIIAVKQLK